MVHGDHDVSWYQSEQFPDRLIGTIIDTASTRVLEFGIDSPQKISESIIDIQINNEILILFGNY